MVRSRRFAASPSLSHPIPEVSALHEILDTVVLAVVLGILAQMGAHLVKVPAILPLLLLGMIAGPQGLHLFDPGALGHGLEVLIHLGVAVILFEGGLSLDVRQLRLVGRPVTGLLTIGVAVTTVGAAWLAHQFVGLPWSTGFLFGAVVSVTGPTVIAPLLRHMIAPRRVRTVLVSEGLMIDPIGAVLAFLVLQWIERAGMDARSIVSEVLEVSLFGLLIGFGAGSAARWVARSRAASGELRNLAILALLFGGFAWSESLAPQSGIVAAVVMGLTMSAASIPDLMHIKAFKGQLTVLFISVLFVLLSGQLDLGSIQKLGSGGALVVAGIVLLVRPVSVLASMPGRELGWKEKTLLGLTAPRGIVAAAVASLAAIQLRAAGMADSASALEGLVYLTILVTGVWATVMAIVLPKLLGYTSDPSRRLVVLVGASPFSLGLGELLRENGWTAAVVDSDRAKLAEARKRELIAVRGDARDASTYEDAGVERDSRLLALTTNDELNLLVAELVRDEYAVEHPVVALQRPSEEFGSKRRAWVDLLGSRGVDLPRWSSRFREGRAVFHTVALADRREQIAAQLRSDLRDEETDHVLLCAWDGDKPHFQPDLDNLDGFERVTLLLRRDEVDEVTEQLTGTGESAEAQKGNETGNA